MTKKYMTLAELAELTGYSRASLTYWIKKGQFKKGTVFKRGNKIIVCEKECKRIAKEKASVIPLN